MHFEDRFVALEDTLRRVATFATILSPDGISVRMLNYSGDEQGWWDNLKTVGDVNRRMDEINYDGGTPLGTRLSSKILEPMILSKAKYGSLKKPVIIVIITDGEESIVLRCILCQFLANNTAGEQRGSSKAEGQYSGLQYPDGTPGL